MKTLVYGPGVTTVFTGISSHIKQGAKILVLLGKSTKQFFTVQVVESEEVFHNISPQLVGENEAERNKICNKIENWKETIRGVQARNSQAMNLAV